MVNLIRKTGGSFHTRYVKKAEGGVKLFVVTTSGEDSQEYLTKVSFKVSKEIKLITASTGQGLFAR